MSATDEPWLRHNSFTFLRLLLAAAVVVGHACALGGFAGDPLGRWSHGQTSLAGLAVLGFFALSGFLLTHSLSVSPALDRFVIHRFFRIMPAYGLSLALSVFFLAPLILLAQTGAPLGYRDALTQGPDSALDYLRHNWALHLRQFAIASVFRENPHASAFNGSLWTLAYEALCYLCLALAGVTGWLRRRHWTLALFLFVYATRVLDACLDTTLRDLAPITLQVIPILSNPTGLPLYLAFLSGMICYQYRAALRWNAVAFIGALAFGIAVTATGHFEIAWPPVLAFIFVYLGRRLPFQRWEKMGDFSYGVYIYAFPLQQCLAMADFQRHGWLAFTAASIALSACAGFASWHCLEKHAVELGRILARRLRETPSIPAPILSPAARS